MLLIKLLAKIKKIYIIGKINLILKNFDVELRRTIYIETRLTYGNKDGKIYHIEK